MAVVNYLGSPVQTAGALPLVGRPCPPFTLVRPDLSELTLPDLQGRRVILNIFPSLDTPVCAKSVYTFDIHAEEVPAMTVVCVSMDLPFAQKRFAEEHLIEKVQMASAFRNPEFGRDFGVLMLDGPLQGLLARAVIALDENGTVVHTELVPELACEANYDLAMDLLFEHHRPCPEDALLTSE